MNPNTFPTKGNLILAKNSLALATQGYGLMDKKRNILLRELMGLIDQAKAIQSEIDSTFTAAYKALQKANIEMGIAEDKTNHLLMHAIGANVSGQVASAVAGGIILGFFM